jgi:hypothetical protein
MSDILGSQGMDDGSAEAGGSCISVISVVTAEGAITAEGVGGPDDGSCISVISLVTTAEGAITAQGIGGRGGDAGSCISVISYVVGAEAASQ